MTSMHISTLRDVSYRHDIGIETGGMHSGAKGEGVHPKLGKYTAETSPGAAAPLVTLFHTPKGKVWVGHYANKDFVSSSWPDTFTLSKADKKGLIAEARALKHLYLGHNPSYSLSKAPSLAYRLVSGLLSPVRGFLQDRGLLGISIG